MSSDPLVRFREALSLLDQLPEEVLSLGDAYGGLPVSGSKAEREQAALPHLQTTNDGLHPRRHLARCGWEQSRCTSSGADRAWAEP